MPPTGQTYLEPQILARVKDLELRAKRIIEGLVSGSHRSPYQGVSVEFAEHREYVPGDDVRHIDWKLFGKTDKFFLKRYEHETNLLAHLVLDTSESMKYTSGEFLQSGLPSGPHTKLLYASYLAASLAYLVIHGHDTLGMTFFEDKIRYHLPPSSQATQLRQVLHLLAVCQPANVKSRIGPVLEDLTLRLRKRSLVIVLSDFFDDVDALMKGLDYLRYKRHEVVVFQILDPAELDFPFRDMTMFEGLESLPKVLVEPRSLRQAYIEEFSEFVRRLRVGCRSKGVDYQQVRTDQPLASVLASYLRQRAARG